MEITDRIKLTVFAPYLMQKIQVRDSTPMYLALITVPNMTGSTGVYENTRFIMEHKLILKPLSEITDEDAIAIGNIEGLANAKITDRNDYKIILSDDSYMLLISYKGEIVLYKNKVRIAMEKSFSAYQYLQFQGYDLPHYLLGDKTLQESGLAIYE